MKVTYENDIMAFDISQGPSAIIEALNARGKDGWITTTSVNVSGEKIVFFSHRKMQFQKYKKCFGKV